MRPGAAIMPTCVSRWGCRHPHRRVVRSSSGRLRVLATHARSPTDPAGNRPALVWRSSIVRCGVTARCFGHRQLGRTVCKRFRCLRGVATVWPTLLITVRVDSSSRGCRLEVCRESCPHDVADRARSDNRGTDAVGLAGGRRDGDRRRTGANRSVRPGEFRQRGGLSRRLAAGLRPAADDAAQHRRDLVVDARSAGGLIRVQGGAGQQFRRQLRPRRGRGRPQHRVDGAGRWRQGDLLLRSRDPLGH